MRENFTLYSTFSLGQADYPNEKQSKGLVHETNHLLSMYASTIAIVAREVVSLFKFLYVSMYCYNI